MLSIISHQRNQIKTQMKYPFTPITMVLVRKTDSNKCWQRYGDIRTILRCWKKCQMVQPFWKTVQKLLKELTMKLVLPRSLTPRFICQNRKQMFTQKLVYKYSQHGYSCNSQKVETTQKPEIRSLKSDERTNKIYCIQTVECYSAVARIDDPCT